MYCSECKLRIADDDVTVCPVCQGPLQPEQGKGDMFDVAVDNVGSVVPENMSSETPLPEGRIDDKFSAYERPDEIFDFNPEEFGLQSSDQKDPAAEVEDIRVLADLWEDEDVDADLEGVLAEAFSLDDVGRDIDDASQSVDEVSDVSENMKDVDSDVEKTDLNVDVDELDFTEGDLALGHSEVIPAPSPTVVQPPVVELSRSRRPLLLILLFVVICAGGAGWFFLQNFGAKPVARVVKPMPLSQPVKLASPPSAKEQIVAKKVTTAESGSGNVQETSGDHQTGVVPARDSAVIESSDLKEKESGTLPQEATLEPVTAVVSQLPAAGQEKLVAQRAEVLDRPVAESVKKSEASAALPENAGEKTSVSGVKLAQDGPKAVAEIKPLAEAVSAAASITEEPAVLPYAIHIGSFRSKKRASSQLAMLQKKGFDAYQVEVDLKEKGVWQRVLVPGGVTREEAQVVQQKLADIFPREDSLIRKIRK